MLFVVFTVGKSSSAPERGHPWDPERGAGGEAEDVKGGCLSADSASVMRRRVGPSPGQGTPGPPLVSPVPSLAVTSAKVTGHLL